MVPRLRLLLAVALGLAVLAACGGTDTPATKYELEVTLAGTGSGTVTSSPAGINAPTTTEAEFNSGTVVTLTATAAAGSDFVVWGGACAGAGGAATCSVTMSAARSVTATFNLEPVEGSETVTVNVVTGGAAAGTVTSAPAGIDTGAPGASFEFALGSTVVLTASATTGGFAGWTGGDCDGLLTLTCSVTVDVGEAPVTANFNDVTQLSLAIAANADDSEEFLADSLTDPVRWRTGFSRSSSSDIELAFDAEHAPQVIGLRFVGVNVPAGARIAKAELGFTAFANPNTGTAGDVALTIRAQASASPSAFITDAGNPATTSFDISSRTLTTASTAWTITGAWTADVAYASSNAAAVLQEVVGLGGWTSGSSVAFVITGEAASTQFRRAYARDSSVASAPTLTIEYVAMPVAP